MKAGARLTLYGAGLVVAFVGAFAIAGAIIPDSFVTEWSEKSDMSTPGEEHIDSKEPGAGHELGDLSSLVQWHALPSSS